METECTNLIWGGSLGVYMDVFLSSCFTQSQSALELCASTWSDLESVFLAIYFTEPAFWCLVSELLVTLSFASSVFKNSGNLKRDHLGLCVAGRSINLFLKSGEQEMSIDKSWMKLGLSDLKYFEGVAAFIDYATSHVKHSDGRIYCPCRDCLNGDRIEPIKVHQHLLYRGFMPDYTIWRKHGENEDTDDDNSSDSRNHSEESEAPHFDQCDDIEQLVDEFIEQDPNGDAQKFYKLLDESKVPLYPGCKKYSNLSFVVNLMHIKSTGNMNNEAFVKLLKLLKNAFPMCEKLPTTQNGAKNIVKELGLHYEKIEACKNDCVIYYNKLAEAETCPKCKLSRWKPQRTTMKENGKKVKKIPWKILRYFPLTPRLQRLFMSSKTAQDMIWHFEDRVKDGVLRHPADAEAWKHFDQIHPLFGDEHRNVRLGLATDGFNPFGNMSPNRSTWPVLLFPYNLPPWMCMKEPYTFLSLLIPGPRGPGNNIDVYLEPLIDELNILWEHGAETYDIYTKQNFQMRAAVMWTINDFPGYGYMSGWCTQGRLACPCCASETPSRRLKNGKRQCYMRNRRLLAPDHKWRKQRKAFDNTKEMKSAPKRQSGQEIVDQLQNLGAVEPGDNQETQVIPGFGKTHNWKKRSILFRLPYWKTLILRHNLDVMHIEKNIFDNVVGTVMNIDGKTKDSLNARHDLQAMGIRKDYWPREEDGKLVYDRAPFELSADDIKAVYEWLLKLKVPDGYCANISRWVNDKRRGLTGMKTHDCHVFLERLLPLVVRELLAKEPCEALIELSYFFKELCAKNLNVSDLELLDNQIATTLCKLEMIFPPAFFTIMVHLSIHLAWEAKVAGPVQYRWMYPVERYLHKLNTYVRNKAHPEGSMAEGYLAEECITFLSRYLCEVETKFNRVERNYDGGQPRKDKTQLSIFSLPGKTIGKGVLTVMSEELHHAASHYILTNCDECLPFIEEHKDILRIQYGDDQVDELHMKTFVKWFSERIEQLYAEGKESAQMFSLAQGSGKQAIYYKGYNIHGFRFHTERHDENKKTQNSGVMVKGEKEINCVPWYGTLTDIVELWYTDQNKVILFHCNWFDTATKGKGYKEDRYGILSVNNKGKLNTQEPFVLASQATQVYYVTGIKNCTWSVVVETKPRNIFEMPTDEEEPYQQEESQTSHTYANRNVEEDDEE